MTGINTLPTRTKFCTDSVLAQMPLAVGRLYVSNYFNKNSKAKAKEMTENILNEFKNILNDVNWMDAVSKQAAIEKVMSSKAL